MDMTPAHMVATLALLAGAFGGTILCCFSQRVRDVFFFLLVAFAPLSERIQVNYFSREWYRGTTRGLEFCGLDMLAFSLLVSAVLFPRKGEKRFYLPASLLLMIVFFLYAVFCVAISDPKIFGIFEVTKMFRGLIIFLAAALFLRSARELKILVYGLCVAVAWQGLLALDQRYLQGIHRVNGTVDDSNSLSMFFCTTAPVLVAAITSDFSKTLRMFCGAAVALAGVGVILTISRTGFVTMALMLTCATLATISYKITPKKIVMTLLVILMAVGVVAKAWKTLNSRFEGDSLKSEYGNTHEQNRGYYIRIAIAIAADHWFGVGPNNWSYWVSNKYGPKLGFRFVPYIGTEKEPSQLVPAGRNIDAAQAAPAHNLAALTAGEMGSVGLFLLALLWMRWLQMGISFLWPRIPDPMRRMGVGIFFGMGGTFLQSLTEWVFRQTPIFDTFNVLLGALASLYYIKKCQRRERRELESMATGEPLPGPQTAFARHSTFA